MGHKFQIRSALKSLENPTFLSRRTPWLYWRVYNFSWSSYYWIFNNNLSKASILASAAGYLLYLNDFLLNDFGFGVITSNYSSVIGIDTRSKLAMIYFGLIFIAAGRVIFLLRRPSSIRFGPSQNAWVNHGLNEFTYYDFHRLHGDIRENGHRTLYGKYYDDEWEAFSDDARWSSSGRTDGMDDDQKRRDRDHVGYSNAKSRHEDVLRSILIDRYDEFSAHNKIGLAVALLFAVVGYILFFLPNVDLFLTIARSFL